MEIVGGVASIITLIEATGVLADVSRNLVQRWRNAPYEIQALATRLSLLAAELQSIRNATERSNPVLIDAVIRQSLGDLLTDARKRLTKLESLHFHLHKHGSRRKKVQWAIKDAAEVEKVLSKTQEVEQRLANLMILISMRAQTPILNRLHQIEQMISTLAVAAPAAALTAQAPVTPVLGAFSSVSPTTTSARERRVLASRPWTLNESWQFWGVRGTFISTTKGPHTDFDISFVVSLPLARILGSYVLTGTLSLRSTPLCRNTLTFRHPSYFAMARVVSEDHPFIQACQKDDWETVRSMLRNGEGRPTDLVAGTTSPMSYAIHSGSIKAVTELLDSGAELDAGVNRIMSSALTIASLCREIDIVRLLLRRGASPDYTDALGLNPTMSCWCGSNVNPNCSSLDIVNLFRPMVEIDIRATNKLGRSVIHAVGSSGNSFQVDTLVRLGSDVRQIDNFGWEPIHHAVFHGNIVSFMALTAHWRQGTIDTGILHIAVAGEGQHMTSGRKSRHGPLRKCEDIIEYLLRHGTDPKARFELSRDFLSPFLEDEVLPKVCGQAITAYEMAAAFGPGVQAWYSDVLRRCSFPDGEKDLDLAKELKADCVTVSDHCTGVDDDEQFWDAEEYS